MFGAAAVAAVAVVAPEAIPEDPAAPVEVPRVIAEGTRWDGGERRTMAASIITEGGKGGAGGMGGKIELLLYEAHNL